MTPFEIGLCAGIAWAAVLVVWALAEMTSGEPSSWLIMVACIYEGFDLTPRGLAIGAAWAFADGFLSGFLISWIINVVLSFFLH
ncbi:MAG: hypothetical protein HQM09_20410 [Candidatus Riflebacteria bacterium]|nr:hypothetical protein [Candidatus Riflebacteria bacterium]